MIPQELKIFRRLEGGKSQKEVLASCTIGLSTVSDLKG
jgi:DNA-binding CsgD family transcriptional regulator